MASRPGRRRLSVSAVAHSAIAANRNIDSDSDSDSDSGAALRAPRLSPR